MLEKTKLILKQSEAKFRSVIADSQYSDSKLRNAVDETVIPYRANQKRNVEDLLRVDKFRPKDTVQPSRQQGQEFEKRCFLCPLQFVVLGSEQRRGRKHQKT
jgi:hypothetical protein